MALVAVTLRRDQLADFFREGTDWGKVLVGVPKGAKLVGIDLHDNLIFYFWVRGNSDQLASGKVVWENQKSVTVETSQLDPKAPIPWRRR